MVCGKLNNYVMDILDQASETLWKRNMSKVFNTNFRKACNSFKISWRTEIATHKRFKWMSNWLFAVFMKIMFWYMFHHNLSPSDIRTENNKRSKKGSQSWLTYLLKMLAVGKSVKVNINKKGEKQNLLKSGWQRKL